MTQRKNIWPAVIGGLAVVYVLLRVWRLTDSCLWFDEIFSVHAASEGWGNLFRFVAQDLIHPPFFYVLLKLWTSAFGESLTAVRLFPLFWATLALGPFLFICRELKISYAATATALGLIAFNGALIKYAQEVRMYAVVFCLALFSLWIFLRYLRLGKNFWILTGINLLLVYTHYFGWLVVAAEIVAVLWLQRIKIGQILLMLGMLLAAFAPWIVTLWQHSGANPGLAQNIGWIARPGPSALIQFAFDLIDPFYFQQSTAEPAANLLVAVPLLLIFLTALILYLVGWKRLEETERRHFILLLIFIKLPVVVALLASWIAPYSVWGTRHLISVFAPLALLLAVALDRLELPPLRWSLLGLVLFLSGLAFIGYLSRPTPEYIWCAWEKLAAGIDRGRPQRIYVFEDLVAYNLWFALRDAGPQTIRIIKIEGLEGLQEDAAYFLPRGFDGVGRTDENGIEGERVLIAYRDLTWNEKHPPLRNFRLKGYRIGEPSTLEAGGVKAFLVEAEKVK